jgi:cation diffusion facilitator CzcD-associated flavoprotein CzcO
MDASATDHVDVLIVGAGLSGIGAAYYLQRDLPHKTYAVLEARDAIGGTWDLFRYPGIRSDSDMHTLGYRFKPWVAAEAIADGPAILGYVRETAAENGIEEHIRFNQRVLGASWSSEDARWTVDVERTDTGEQVQMTCGYLFGCTGYYRYDRGYLPEFPGVERFGGTLVHPQFWPEDLDHAGKRVVVIGSGATAVTLVPAMSHTAADVKMLQRSPTYIVSLPGKDPIANGLRRVLPDRAAYVITRWKNVLMQAFFYQLARRRPKLVKGFVRAGVKRRLPKGYPVDTHFRPKYNPWDERVCLVPDSDLFEAISAGRAEMVTDTIETFTETGIRLSSGRELEADIVVAATGLNLVVIGGMQLTVDGEEVVIPESMTYKAMMLEGVPNFAFSIGYTNASWTLKCDLTCEYVVRVLKHMDEHGYVESRPVNTDPGIEPLPFLDFTSGYVQRALKDFPKQGSQQPWRLRQNYAADIVTLRYGKIDDGAMAFRPA